MVMMPFKRTALGEDGRHHPIAALIIDTVRPLIIDRCENTGVGDLDR